MGSRGDAEDGWVHAETQRTDGFTQRRRGRMGSRRDAEDAGRIAARGNAAGLWEDIAREARIRVIVTASRNAPRPSVHLKSVTGLALGLQSKPTLTASLNEITGQVVDAAVKLHAALGPGLLESVYQAVLSRELERRGLMVESQRALPFEYDGMRFSQGLCVDLLVNASVVVELKSVEKLAPVHFKQVLTYLRLLDLRVGLLINFGGATLKEGLHRIINSDPGDLGRPVSSPPPRKPV